MKQLSDLTPLNKEFKELFTDSDYESMWKMNIKAWRKASNYLADEHKAMYEYSNGYYHADIEMKYLIRTS